jgi:Flp pilus assembly protein TadG
MPKSTVKKNLKRSPESGSAILELAIVVPFLTVLFFGSTGLGIMMGRYIQAQQVARDIAHMYSDGIDFSQTANQNIAVQLTSGTGMTATGGNGVVILSKIQTVYQADCAAANISNGSCVNATLPVFTQRVVVGNIGLHTSNYGTPAAAILDPSGNIAPTVFMQNTNSTVRTTGFEAQLDDAVLRGTGTAATPPAQAQGEVAFVCEVFFTYPDIGFLGFSTQGGAYAQFIFH